MEPWKERFLFGKPNLQLPLFFWGVQTVCDLKDVLPFTPFWETGEKNWERYLALKARIVEPKHNIFRVQAASFL